MNTREKNMAFLRQLGEAPIATPNNPHECAKLKAESLRLATELNDKSMLSGKEFTPEEQAQFYSYTDTARACSSKLQAYEKGTGRPYGEDHRALIPGSREIEGGLSKLPTFPGVADFINNGAGGVQASLGETGSLQYVVPGWQVENFIQAFPSVDPFGQAGATVFNTDDAHTVKIPIVTQGANVGTFAEGSGPSSAQDAGVYVASLEATKYAFLTKVSEEVSQDIPGLETTLAGEGLKRVALSITRAVTAALITSLNSASAVVSPGSDYLQTLLGMEAALDLTWAQPNNVWMMDRSSLSLFRNTRDLQNRPIFDPVSRTLLSYKVVLNDALHGRVLFGSFGPACYIRKTPLVLQRLVELYSEAGQIGIRFQQRADQAFFSDAANASQAPQPILMLTTDVGS